MFTGKKEPGTPLETVIDKALLEMSNHEVTSERYGQALDRVAKLHKMKEDSKPSQVSPDTLVVAATNLIGILLILRHERVDIITSKALGFVARSR